MHSEMVGQKLFGEARQFQSHLLASLNVNPNTKLPRMCVD